MAKAMVKVKKVTRKRTRKSPKKRPNCGKFMK